MDTIMTDAPSKMESNSDVSPLIQTPHSDAFAFSDQEKRILALYDQIQDLELQQSFFQTQAQAQTPDVSALSDDGLQTQLTNAENEAAEARAEYLLRAKVTQNVMVTDPILKAIHGGANTGYAEKRILPLITERDVLSMVHGSVSSDLTSALHALTVVEKSNAIALSKNKKLAQTLLALTQNLKGQLTSDIEDPQLRKEVEDAEKEVKTARRTAKLLKGVISGMIVGSGVNWADDVVLRELVMDDEDD
ncbi:hypothetical protein GQ43DRAFT_384722 [Delitschia confertaspora ATCC 74209]|uniref:Centromere protein H C-terminal domain-containing protein n=1 Tax=Delitschia confertaspora ATCC 74209 TaxID=1513339 RepID=A0A9P4JYL7_9PLEO|nr:hypothetical protein GQ43DRAFT_384722 [Delitschia confertaspora ATCC 74209]